MRLASLTLLLLSLGLAAPALAQDPVPDTTSAWRYFPLEIGNVWEYEYTYFAGGLGSRSLYLQVTVEADSLVEGVRYRVLRNDAFDADGHLQLGDPVRQLVRFDTTGAMAVTWTTGGEVPWGPVSPPPDLPIFLPLQAHVCRYDADFGAPVVCGTEEGWTSGGYDQPTGLGDFRTAVKHVGPPSLIGQSYTLAADLGPLEDHVIEENETHRELRYARIGGIEYGEPLPLSSAPPSGEAPSGLALHVAPNPFRGSATLELAVPVPQAVTFEVFDALGRRVHAEAHAVSGAARLVLAGSLWAPGVYVVRVTGAEGQFTTTRIVKR